MSKKFTSSIAGASVFIAVFSIISKGIGFFREILFASLFGLSPEFDIYLVGAALPFVINTIILSLAQNYIIPTFNKIKISDDESSIRFIQTVFYGFNIIGILFSLILFVFSELIISTFICSNDLTLNQFALNIFNLLLITIPLNCASSVLISYQQSNFEFRHSILSHIYLNVIVLIIVFAARNLSIYTIPLGYILGSVVQLLFLMHKSRNLFVHPVRLFAISGFQNKLIPSTLFMIILIESISQLYIVSDRYFFSKVSSGGISALNYAYNIFMLPISIVSIALSTAIFPKLSELYNKRIFLDLKKILNEAIIVIIAIFTPIMFLFILYGNTIIKIIFERGKFSSSDTLMTGEILFFFSLSIVFYATYGIFNKLIYSSGLIKKLLIITIMGIILKIVLNYMFVQEMEQNGLALGTSVSYLFFFIASFLMIRQELSIKSGGIFVNEAIIHFCTAILSFYLSKRMVLILPNSILTNIFEVNLFLIIYLISLYVLNSSSIQILKRVIKNLKRL